MLLSSLGVQVLDRDPKTTVKILNACSTTRKSWRGMYSINYENRYLINISKLEEEEVGKELGGYCSPHPSVIIRKKIGGEKVQENGTSAFSAAAFPLLAFYVIIIC